MKWTISLENMSFFARHGWYEEEMLKGNDFTVDIFLDHELPEYNGEDELSLTINYEQIFDIVKKQMDIPAKLLETVCWRIKNDLINEFGEIASCRIKISKKNPPLPGSVGCSGVELRF